MPVHCVGATHALAGHTKKNTHTHHSQTAKLCRAAAFRVRKGFVCFCLPHFFCRTQLLPAKLALSPHTATTQPPHLRVFARGQARLGSVFVSGLVVVRTLYRCAGFCLYYLRVVIRVLYRCAGSLCSVLPALRPSATSALPWCSE